MSYPLINEIKIPAYIAYDSGNEWTIRCDNFESLNSTHNNNNHPCKSDPKTFTNIIDASNFLKKFDLVIPKNVEIKTQGNMDDNFNDHTIEWNPVRAGAKNNYVQWDQDSWLQTRYERDKLLKNRNNGLIQFIPNEGNINNVLNKPKHNLFKGDCSSDNKIINRINTNVKLYDDIGHLHADGDRKYVRYKELIPTRVDYNTNFTCSPTTSYLENVLSTKEYTGAEFSSEVGRGVFQLDGAIKKIDYNPGNDKVTIYYYKLKDNYSKNIVTRPAIEIEKKNKYKIFAKNYSGNESSYEKGISELSDRGMIIDSLTASLSYLDNNEISCTEGYGLAGFKIEGPNNNKYKITPYCLLIDEVVEEDGSKRNPTDPPKDPEETPWYLSTVAIIAYVVIGIIVIIVIIAIIFAASSGSGSSSPTVIPEGYEVVPY